MLKRRAFAAFMCLVLCALTLCACSEEPSDITLRTSTILGSSGDYAVYSSLVTQYSASHPEITIRDTSVEREDSYKLALTAAQTYTALDSPDVVCFAPGESIENVEEYFVTLEEIRQIYPEFALDTMSAAQDTCGISVRGDWYGSVCSTELCASAPQTWAQLVNLAQQYSSQGLTLFAHSASSSGMLLEYLLTTFCGETVDADTFAAREDAAQVLTQALECISQLMDAGAFAPEGSDAVELFNSGRAAMIFISSRDSSKLTAECVFAPLPAPDGAAVENFTLGGYSERFYITRKAFADEQKREYAVSFVVHMQKRESAGLFASSGALSARSDCAGESSLSRSALEWAQSGSFISSRSATNAQVSFAGMAQPLARLAAGQTDIAQTARLMLEDMSYTQLIEELSASDLAASTADETALSQSDAAIG